MSKRLLLLSFIAVLALSALVGCQAQTETVQVAGSTSVQPLSEVLAEKYMEDNKNITVTITGGGSTAGVTAAQNGAANIGAASRQIKEEEIASGLKVYKIAIDGIAIIVNNDNPVSELSSEQIQKVYTGEISNWKEVGGNDAAIAVVTREAGSGTLDAFESILMNKQAIKTDANVQSTTGGVRAVVQGDVNAIGYISMGSMNTDVKAVKVDGSEASEENIRNGSYNVWRPFNYVTKGEATGSSKKFIDWVLSDAGQDIVASKGFFKR